MTPLRFSVIGRAYPQGSKRAIPTKAGIRLVEQSKGVGPYREAVARGAMVAAADLDDETRGALLQAPVQVTATFYLARPAGHHRTGRHFPDLRPSAPARPAVMPDVDKLARALLDGLVVGRAIRDDGQVVDLIARKRYTAHGAPERTDIELVALPRTIAQAEQEALAA